MRRSLSVAVRLTLLLCLLGLPAAAASASSLGLDDPVLLYGPEPLQLTVQGVVVHEVETFSTSPSDDVPVEGLGFQLSLAAQKDNSGADGSGEKKIYEPPVWLAGDPNWATWTTTGVFFGAWAALYANSSVETIEEVGDVTQILPALTGMGMALGTKDWVGTRQYIYGLLTATAMTHFQKNAVDKYRPNASNTQSYPSGHTQASFSGAGFIQRRYGPKWGIPAMVMASYTAFSRVRAQKHFTDDVISGMSIGLIGNWIFVDPADKDRKARANDMKRKRKFRYEWAVTDANVTTNLVMAPKEGGTLTDWQFDETTDPQITASVGFDWMVRPRHILRFRYSPFEIRDIGTLTQETVFGDRTFASGQDVFSAYFLGDLRSRYAFDIFPDSRWTLQAGGGFTWINTTVDLWERDAATGTIDETTRTTVRAKGFLPLAHVRAGVDFAKILGFYVEADGISVSHDDFFDGRAYMKFKVSPRWDLAAGWRWFGDDLELDSLVNEFAANGFYGHVGFSF
jgi:membrane-associated phospholipid phosphatase